MKIFKYMGNKVPVQKINFEDMQSYIKSNSTIIISTLPINNQSCLIINTLDPDTEISMLNNMLKKNTNVKIIIYGMNACDNLLINKYNQLIKLGFTNIFVYPGGLFEWLLLQDIYGNEDFPTTKKELDILKYKGDSSIKRLDITLHP